MSTPTRIWKAITVGVPLVALGITLYTFNMAYHVDRIEEINQEMGELIDKKENCENKLTEHYQEINGVTEQLKYVASKHQGTFIDEQLIPAIEGLNVTRRECMPTLNDYVDKAHAFKKESASERKQTFNPFYKLTSRI